MEFIPKQALHAAAVPAAAARPTLREIGVAAVAAALGMVEEVGVPSAAGPSARAEQDARLPLSKKAA